MLADVETVEHDRRPYGSRRLLMRGGRHRQQQQQGKKVENKAAHTTRVACLPGPGKREQTKTTDADGPCRPTSGGSEEGELRKVVRERMSVSPKKSSHDSRNPSMFFLSMLIQALRDWIMHEDQVFSSGRSTLADVARGNPFLAQALDALAAGYRAMTLQLGLGPIPDQLEAFGPAGEILKMVTCETKGCWAAFRRGVERRYPTISYPTPLTEGAHTLASFAERVTLRWLAPLSGISRIDVHPPLAGTSMSADLLVTAVTGRSVYIEVVGMLTSATSADRDEHCASYRTRLRAKLETYSALGIEPPVLVFMADLTPSGLTAKCTEVLARLGLPASALPASSGWAKPCHGGGLAA